MNLESLVKQIERETGFTLECKEDFLNLKDSHPDQYLRLLGVIAEEESAENL